jgi:hypothetical protein
MQTNKQTTNQTNDPIDPINHVHIFVAIIADRSSILVQQRGTLARTAGGGVVSGSHDAGDSHRNTAKEDDGHDGEGERPLERDDLGEELSGTNTQSARCDRGDGITVDAYPTPKPAARKAVAKPT